MVRRSLLFSPGDRQAMLLKAPTTGADVIVFDLEDAVSVDRKQAAREAVGEVLGDPSFDPACEVCVRVNPSPVAADDDLAAVLGGRLDAVMLPKVSSAEDVETLARLLDERDATLPVMALVETAAGVLHAAEIAAAAPTDALVFGAEDFRAEIGAARTPEATEVLYARQRLVVAAAAAGIDAIDMVYTAFRDVDGLTREAQEARRLGFDGKPAIHPSQVAPINEAFAPDEDEVAWARRVLAARDEGGDRGAFEVDGEMIDAPLLARAERIVERSSGGGDRHEVSD